MYKHIIVGSPIETLNRNFKRTSNTLLEINVDPLFIAYKERFIDYLTKIISDRGNNETIIIPSGVEIKVATLKRILFGQQCYVIDYLKALGMPLEQTIKTVLKEQLKDNKPSVSKK